MHFLYIIFSKKVDKYYVGESTSAFSRIQQHNKHYFKKNFTKIASDWEIKLLFQTNTKADALFLEKFIKRMKSRVFIEKLIDNPDILVDILNKK